MAGGHAEFEVQAMRGERWTTEEVRETESAARAISKTVLNRGSVSGIRIVKMWHRADGQVTETLVHEEMRAVAEAPVSIVPIDDAPMCTELAHFYRLESRLTMGRILRKYLEQAFLTPTELLHNHKALKRVQDADTLFPSAVDRIATIQSKATGQDIRARRDELFKFAGQASQRARKAEESGSLPPIKDKNFAAAIAKVRDSAPAEEVDFYVKATLSRDLVQQRAWLAKLSRVAELLDPKAKDEAIEPLDGVIAELVTIPAAMQDILGEQRNLGAALMSILDLHDHGQPAQRTDAQEELKAIGPLIVAGRLTQTRKALLDRVVRQLGSSQPLSRNDPSKERDVIKELMERLFREETIVGGPDTAAAMTKRFVYLQEGGGLAALKQSVTGVVNSLKTIYARLVYLLELGRSELAKELRETINENLRKLIEVNDLSLLAPRDADLTHKLLAVKRVFETLKSAPGLPDAERARLVERIDTLLTEFIRREGIIEKLDNPNAPLRERAQRLVEFCGSGVLPDGRALRLARERVVAHLKQPNFDRAFIDGIGDVAKSAEVLRDFHSRLIRAGFR